MISPKYHQILERKATVNQIKNLAHDLQKSNIAVENITKFQVGQGKFKNKIDRLQVQLQSSLTNINMQSKRYKILGELISILKGQMFNYQKTKKKQQQAQQALKDKLIGKLQYQIDQILQKHNQQIAKINSLKDLANSRRSERVVYSSLFKKLQKQIKYYEEIYKQQLIISQYIESKPKFAISDLKEHKEPRLNHTQSKQFFQLEQKKKNQQQNTKLKGQVRFSIPRQNHKNELPCNVFITSNKQQSSIFKPSNFSNQKKFHSTSQQKQELKNSLYRQQKLAHTKDILKKISQYTNIIQKIKVHSQCASTQEILSHYSQIEEQNKNLMKKISQCDDSIQKISKLNSKVQKNIASEQVQTKGAQITQRLNFGELMGIQIANQNIFKDTQVTKKLQGQLEDIANTLNIKLQKDQNNVYTNQSLILLDKKIKQLQNKLNVNGKSRDWSHRQDTMFSQTLVDCLLERMDKFSHCQRILDRELFQQEYYKELGKKRQIKSRKQAR